MLSARCLGLIVVDALGWGNVASIALPVVLAFFFGYSLTMVPLLRAEVALASAIPLAFASDTLSIAVMEIVDNLFTSTITGTVMRLANTTTLTNTGGFCGG